MSTKQNRYFMPGEGIRREVITADICRYLGNDALVKPGHYEGRDGFWITAYRALTSAMISDLKADSARWEMESAQVDPRNIGAVPYPDSRTHEYRQYYGPTPSPAQGPYGPQEPLDRRGLQSATGYDQYASQAQQGYPPQGYPPQGAYPLQGAYSGQDYPNTNQEYAVTSGGPYPNAGQPRTVPPYPPYQGMPNSEGTYSSTSYPSGSEGTPYNPPQSNMVQRGQQSSQPPPRGDQYRHNAYK